MQRFTFGTGRQGHNGRRRQKGQALIYGLFVLIGGLGVLFFLFNTGQLTHEKTKLVNTADAAIYSAGVMQARELNFQAYTNRAMVANTVAIAQLVSLSSWVQFVDNVANYGYVLDNPKFAYYYGSYYLAESTGGYLQDYLNESGALEDAAQASDKIIQGLMAAQDTAHFATKANIPTIIKNVVKENYINDGEVAIDEEWLISQLANELIKSYSGDDRERFAEVAKTAANLDAFVPRRTWILPGMWADCASATPRVDWLDRRGGTNLIGFDEWKAVDTLSEKSWTPSNKTDVFCMAVAETPAGWALQSAADNSSTMINPTDHDYSLLVNPTATGAAIGTSSDAWDYSGLPSFYDLKDTSKAVFRLSVRLSRDISQSLTSEGRSAIKNTPRLNVYKAQAVGKALSALSVTEVYFDRDATNKYGETKGKPTELPSLFNPFWHVHLVQPSQVEILAARLRQAS